MIKRFLLDNCPECGETLTLDFGKKDDTVKLVCKNPDCSGTSLKKLQKGIVALEIKGIGPSTIESLVEAGIETSYDLFDPSKFNEKSLIDSGAFKKGRALQKLIQSVKSVKTLPIDKVILSLQYKDIGKTFSLKIGQMLSGLTPDFSGLQLDIRQELENENSKLCIYLKESIKKFEDFGVEVVRFTLPKKVEAKKVNKLVDSTVDISDILEKLGWELVDVKSEGCQLLVVENKDEANDKVKFAKNSNIKIMTLKQIKLLFL